MKVATPKETAAEERRVALVPDTATKLVAAGLQVSVEAGAGAAAYLTDEAYRTTGVSVVGGVSDLLRDADAVLKVQAPSVAETPAPTAEELRLLREELDPTGLYSR